MWQPDVNFGQPYGDLAEPMEHAQPMMPYHHQHNYPNMVAAMPEQHFRYMGISHQMMHHQEDHDVDAIYYHTPEPVEFSEVYTSATPSPEEIIITPVPEPFHDYARQTHAQPSCSQEIDVGMPQSLFDERVYLRSHNRYDRKKNVVKLAAMDSNQGELQIAGPKGDYDDLNENPDDYFESGDEYAGDSDEERPFRKTMRTKYTYVTHQINGIQRVQYVPPNSKELNSAMKRTGRPKASFQQEKLRCNYCHREVLQRSNQRTSKITNALTHAKMHVKRRQFECSKCHYQSNTHIQRHVANIHNGEANIIDRMDDDLRCCYRDMAIECFPELENEVQAWFKMSSDGQRPGGRKSKNRIKPGDSARY
ncbi:unnamed protein product, partial [Mesorhabditis spiculigera]